MIAPASPIATKPAESYRDSQSPTLVFALRSGFRYGWPLHALNRWVLIPGAEQRVEISLGHGESVTLVGVRLDEITEALDAGKGGEITEHEKRYRAIAAPTRAYVDEVKVVIPGQQFQAEDRAPLGSDPSAA